MKKFSFYSSIFVLMISCQGAGGSSEQGIEEIEKSDPITWKVKRGTGGKEGYVDQNGNVMIACKFDRASKFEGDIAQVMPNENSGLMFFINPKGNIVSDGFDYFDTYEYPLIIGNLKDDNGKYQEYLIDTLGKTLFGPFAKIEAGNLEGTFIVSEPCDTCGYRDKRQALMDNNGDLITPWFAYLGAFNQKHFYEVQNFVNDDPIEAAMNWKGQIISKWYSDVGAEIGTEDYFQVRDDEIKGWNHSGMIDSTGKEMIPLNYWMIDYYPRANIFVGERKVGTRDYFDIISSKGKILKKSFSKDFKLSKGSDLVALQQSGKTYAYFRLENEELVKVGKTYPMIRSTYSWSNNGFLGLGRHRSGTSVKYYIPEFVDGFSPFTSKGKLGFINENLEIVIPAKYDKVGEFKNGKSKVSIGEEEFEIDTLGNKLNN